MNHYPTDQYLRGRQMSSIWVIVVSIAISISILKPSIMGQELATQYAGAFWNVPAISRERPLDGEFKHYDRSQLIDWARARLIIIKRNLESQLSVSSARAEIRRLQPLLTAAGYDRMRDLMIQNELVSAKQCSSNNGKRVLGDVAFDSLSGIQPLDLVELMNYSRYWLELAVIYSEVNNGSQKQFTCLTRAIALYPPRNSELWENWIAIAESKSIKWKSIFRQLVQQLETLAKNLEHIKQSAVDVRQGIAFLMERAGIDSGNSNEPLPELLIADARSIRGDVVGATE